MVERIEKLLKNSQLDNRVRKGLEELLVNKNFDNSIRKTLEQLNKIKEELRALKEKKRALVKSKKLDIDVNKLKKELETSIFKNDVFFTIVSNYISIFIVINITYQTHTQCICLRWY